METIVTKLPATMEALMFCNNGAQEKAKIKGPSSSSTEMGRLKTEPWINRERARQYYLKKKTPRKEGFPFPFIYLSFSTSSLRNIHDPPPKTIVRTLRRSSKGRRP
ncbi:hypothetical protein NE237_024332 [Protea cynaroides]|uniref:Uncharacterized protein n=1 Tax=Protea cynaroides TaxID=273540 RepID=A0A9Q0HDP9_9MAGN|nr:hypothetical protein NE237_024332 [Protea cynaroides]